MIIKLINKDTLIVGEFKLKCCIGRNGISKNKIEEILKHHVVRSNLVLYTGDLIELKNLY